MRVPLDQPIRLTFNTFSDAAETVPADPTTVSLQVQAPDGTETTYTWAASQVVKDSTGVFHYDYTPATAGHYAFHWTGAGAVTTSLDGELDVAAKYDQQLVGLDVVKKHLTITTTTNDDELTAFIARATPIIEALTGPVVRRTVTAEQHNNVRGNCVALLERPVLSATMITEYVGKATYPVTVAATPDATGTYGATLDGEKGVLTRWASGTPQNWGQTVWVTYIAGRSAVPANIEQATLELIRHMWETQRGAAAGGLPLDPETGGTVVPGYTVPYRVIETLGEEARIDGFA